MAKVALALALIGVGITQSAPRQANCAPGERRAAAIRYARDLNSAEAAAFFQLKSYYQLEQLPVKPLPEDYAVQLSTDGATYAFSIKDKADPCHGALFSDQDGVIYTGVPIQ